MVLVLLFIGASHPNVGDKVVIVKDGNEIFPVSDFRRDGEIILIPFQESLDLLGLSGFIDNSAKAFFVKASDKLIVVDLITGDAACESTVQRLSRPPLLEAAGGNDSEKTAWLPDDFYTGALSSVLGESIEVVWIKPDSDLTRTNIPDSRFQDPVDVVVIDPGHGGDDLGAEGPDDLLEKDFVLLLGLMLKKKLEAEPGLSVFMTRTTDKAVDLDERARMANKRNADLFLSLHANAAEYVHASGFETYFLSLKATDEASRQLAWLENQGMDIQPGSSNPSSDLDMILGDMAQTEHLKDSEYFAAMVQENLARVMESENRGVKQAPFRVLMGANMPAVLVEVGFLSNLKEARSITRPENRRKIVEALADSIIEYRRIQHERQGIVFKKAAQ